MLHENSQQNTVSNSTIMLNRIIRVHFLKSLLAINNKTIVAFAFEVCVPRLY